MKSFKSTLLNYSSKENTLVFEVPGFSKEDLKITLDKHVMHITGKKEILGQNYEVDKKFALPNNLLSDDPITAKVENGLLYINLKKSEKPVQKEILIS